MSNETPRQSHEKTKSARSSRFVTLSAPLLLLCLCVAATAVLLVTNYNPDEASSHVVFGGKQYSVDAARTQAEQERGLGGRSTLAPKAGMLFVFDEPVDQCFWMKDMLFPIDMIWLDKDGKVITIAPNVSPETYPNDFCPDKPASYVLEVVAGDAARRGVRVGDSVQIRL